MKLRLKELNLSSTFQVEGTGFCQLIASGGGSKKTNTGIRFQILKVSAEYRLRYMKRMCSLRQGLVLCYSDKIIIVKNIHVDRPVS